MPAETSQRHGGAPVRSPKPPVTSPHSGHFMTSNLDDDDDFVDGLGRGLGVEEPEPCASDVIGHTQQSRQQRKGYNFEDACKTPKDTYRFNASNNKHYIMDFDNSLNKLFACMSLAYSGKLSTPKFKAFKGMKINVWDKMRLNNIIWREWHLQFVQKHRPLVCSFTVQEDTHTKPQSVVLEGKYWKRKLGIVCVEYQKWRVFYKKRMMPLISKEQMGIRELLERVADQDGRSHALPIQTQMDGDQFPMDFSDTLFSALTSNVPAANERDEFQALANSDLMHPNLIGLQPSLDDLGSMDSMDPAFQDLLSDALGWNSASLHPSASRMNIYDSKSAPAVGCARCGSGSGYEPLQTPIQVYSSLSPYVSQPLPYQGTQCDQLTPLQLQLHTQSPSSHFPAKMNVSLNTDNAISIDAPATSTYAFVGEFNNQLPQQQQQQQIHSWQQTQFTLAASQFSSTSGRDLLDLSTTSNDSEFAMPKVVRRPRTIAPKSPILAQLLVNKRTPSNLTPNPIIAPTQPSPRFIALPEHITNTKTATPDLAAISIKALPAQSTPTTTQATRRHSLGAPGKVAERNLRTTGLTVAAVAFPDEVFNDPSKVHCSAAEQKRRSHIRNGFDALQTLVPALASNPTSKVSKAAMLIKAAEYAQKLKIERQQMQQEAAMLHNEIEALNTAICACQAQLPATGVPPPTSLSRHHSDQTRQMLNAYISQRTGQNWKFYIFSQLAIPLFESYNTMASTASVDELSRTTQAWVDQHCTLPALRPAILNSLRSIGTDTSILFEPDKFPEQARAAVFGQQKNEGEQPDSPASVTDSVFSHDSRTLELSPT